MSTSDDSGTTLTPISRILNRSGEDCRRRDDNGLGAAPSDSGEFRGQVSAPIGAQSSTNPTTSRLTDTPISNARNGLQVLALLRARPIPAPSRLGTPTWQSTGGGDIILRFEGERAYLITESELAAVEARISAAIAQLEAERRARLEILKLQVRRHGQVHDQLRLMEQTNRELQDAASGFLDVAIAGVDR